MKRPFRRGLMGQNDQNRYYLLYYTKYRNCQVLLALVDDFRTFDWLGEYPAPAFVLKQIQELFSYKEKAAFLGGGGLLKIFLG